MAKTLEFRTLKANEIDCRINTVSEKGITLLLYKDARVDQNILDETVGPMNWQRHHSRENANCTVAIWDDEKKQWIEKEDTGKESFTEAEKGIASDSFKRACFNWGIGRELYTAPFIWIGRNACDIKENGKDRNGKTKYTCYDRFQVTLIEYSENREINGLMIENPKKRCIAYQMGSEKREQPLPEDAINYITEIQVNELFFELKRTKVGLKNLLSNYHLSDIHEMSMDQYADAMKTFQEKFPKLDAPPTDVPTEIEADKKLPWNTPGG